MSFGLYAGALAAAIHHFKFYGARRLYRPLGDLLLSFDISGADALVPVPLSAAGLRARGFNQSLLLARRISAGKGVPVIMEGLLKGAYGPRMLSPHFVNETGDLCVNTPSSHFFGGGSLACRQGRNFGA